ncbi:MAG: hypothetical protein LBN43_02760 [Oscillospiraceae bacterium]|jgi:hypothetical protein|nr:hypothetical protein [Oscillospiraceae bacterium]
MKLKIEKSVVTFSPENQEETNSLEHLWRLLIDCNGPTLKLCPIGEYVPVLGETGAMFYIEGLERSNDPKILEFAKSIEYNPTVVDEDCTVYCSICNKTVDLKKGDTIPMCCGKLMVNIDY